MPELPGPVLPDYGGACIDGVASALRERQVPDWLPEANGLAAARQIVLLVLDGLGWDQLQERPALAPGMAAMTSWPITSVVPTTTAVALTSITTGLPPAGHGVVGYRVAVPTGKDGALQVLNMLRW